MLSPVSVPGTSGYLVLLLSHSYQGNRVSILETRPLML